MELRDQRLSFKIIEIDGFSADKIVPADKIPIPSPITCGRVLVKDALDREGVVGIDPEGQSLILSCERIGAYSVELLKIPR
jgi:hypothetical protein